MDKTYNGWSNYATWRVNLEIFDGLSSGDIPALTRYSEPSLSDVADYLNEYAQDIIYSSSTEGLARDYALAFLDEVNWYEIGQMFIDAWLEQLEDERAEEEQE